MFYLGGVVITFFLILLLIGKKGKSTADIILACWLGVIGLHLLMFYLFITEKIFSYPWMLGIPFPFPLLHGPFLYLYAAELTGRRSSNFKSFLHFIPALICYIYLIPFILKSPEEKITVFKNHGAGYEVFQKVLTIAIFISGIIYIILTTILYKKHKRIIINQFSNTEKINLDWILYLIYGIGVIWFFVIFTNDDLIFGAAVFFVVFMGFFGIRQTPIFTSLNPPMEPLVSNDDEKVFSNTSSDNFTSITNPETFESSESNFSEKQEIDVAEIYDHEIDEVQSTIIEKKKYKNSALEKEVINNIHARLTELMSKEKLYTNPEISLGEIAEKLDVHPNYLSQVINTVEKKSFYDYINLQRVEEFNRIVKDEKNKKFTLLSLAYQCGFNSKTSFNRNFRKVTGFSPSEYLKEKNVNLDLVN